MRKTGPKAKKILSILLTVVMLATSVPFVLAEDASVQAGDILQFGTYPQTQVAETEELKAAAEEADRDGNAGFIFDFSHATYTADPERNLRVEITDFFSNTQKYRRIRFAQYRPQITNDNANANHSIQDENGYVTDTYYYFKYEPLKWCVLDPASGLVLCESIIDAQPYQNVFYTETTIYPQTTIKSYQGRYSSVLANDYAASSIRDWLNEDFFETAFTDAQKENIQTTALNNDAYDVSYSQFDSAETNDKIFLLSYADATNGIVPDYAKAADGTDYAKCRGLAVVDEATSYWLLRSAGLRPDHACCVDYDGNATPNATVGACNGVRPACVLSALTQNAAASETVFSARCKYLVNLTTGRGGDVSPVSGLVGSADTAVTAKVTPNALYTFDGWYNGETKVSEEEAYTFIPAGDMTLTAQYIAPKHVDLVLDGPLGGAVVNGKVRYRYLDTATFTVILSSGYHFLGWYVGTEKVSDDLVYSFLITEDVVLTAKYEQDTTPEEPTNPTNPTNPSDPPAGSDDNNGSGMNFFQKLIQWILNFFRKLFG